MGSIIGKILETLLNFFVPLWSRGKTVEEAQKDDEHEGIGKNIRDHFSGLESDSDPVVGDFNDAD